jgi:hypothetical protein
MFSVSEKECGLTHYKEPTVLALMGANVSLCCPAKGKSFSIFMWKGTTVPFRILFKDK